jgi:hypothetical protein
MKEMEEEGISKREVMWLLNEIEMVGECGTNMMEEDESGQECTDVSMQEVLEILPEEILPTVHELGTGPSEECEQGYSIPEVKENLENKSQEGAQGERELEMLIDTDLGKGSKKSKWGPVQVRRRSSRIQNDGRTSLEKAKPNKKKGDLEENYTKGKNDKPSNSLSRKQVMGIAKSVGVDLGKSEGEIDANINACRFFYNSRTRKQLEAHGVWGNETGE